jgi:hypothetical protein
MKKLGIKQKPFKGTVPQYKNQRMQKFNREVKELQRKQRTAMAQNKPVRVNSRLQEARTAELQRILRLPEEPRDRTGRSERNRAVTAYFNNLARKLPKTHENVLGNLYKSTMANLKTPPNSNSNSPNHKKKKTN